MLRQNVRRLAQVILLGYVGVAVGLIFWQLVRAPALVVREDNPRLVVAEQKTHRGSLLDSHGVVLAHSELDADGIYYVRRYPHVETVPGVGYYSLRYGAGAAEATFDSTLRGTLSFIDQLLHRPQQGESVALSLDLQAQQAASQTLGGHLGAVVMIDVSTGAVPVLVSHPLFDPNTLDAAWEELAADPTAPLLNRATQGSYPLGDMARWVGLTGLLSAGTTVPPDPALTPLDELISPLSQEGYMATCRQLGFDQRVPFELVGGEGRLPLLEGKTTVRDVAVTPVHLARWMAGIARDGSLPGLTIANSRTAANAQPAFSPGVALALRAATDTYGDLAGWVGVATEQETGTDSLCWFVGYWPAESPRYSFAVVVEDCGTPNMTAVSIAETTVAALR